MLNVWNFGLPGSILRVKVSPHPVTYGLPSEVAVFCDEPIAFLVGFLSPSQPGQAYIHFFGVELEVVKIGTSIPAPLFNVVVNLRLVEARRSRSA